MNEQAKLIYQIMPKLIGEVSPVGKNHTNSFHKYKFRAVDDLMAALNPILAKYGVTLEIEHEYIDHLVTEKNTHVFVETVVRWFATDGSFVTGTFLGEGQDTADKASNKAMASGMKYCILQTLQVPIGDRADSEFSS